MMGPRTRILLNFLALSGIVFLTGRLYAQEVLDLPEYPLPEAGTATVGAFRFILAFLVVVAALYGFFYLMKRLSGQGNRVASSRYITLMDTFQVRGHGTLSLVKVGERILLIGQSGNSMRELAEFTEEELTETGHREPFVNYLDTWFRRKKEQ